jgi:segregation and condensation protein B
VVEVLALVAYYEPISLERINELWGKPSGGALSTLIRRGLIRLQRDPDRPKTPDYFTTERFLRLFRLDRLEDLPRTLDVQAA